LQGSQKASKNEHAFLFITFMNVKPDMESLSLPSYTFRVRKYNEKLCIFDAYRKKFVALTPEEWVRQNFLTFLVREKEFPSSMLAVETGLEVNNNIYRCDAIFFDSAGQPKVVIECKAPSVLINQQVFDQIARYNFILHACFLIVTNGKNHYCCRLDYSANQYVFLRDIPLWKELR